MRRSFTPVLRAPFFALTTAVLGAFALGCNKEHDSPSVTAAAVAPGEAGATGAVAIQAPPATTVPQLPPPSDLAAPPSTAAWSSSGVASSIVTHGNGRVHPYDLDLVQLRFVGWTRDGRTFDATQEPVTMRVRTIYPPGLAESLHLMVAGEKRRFWIPAALGFGDRAQPNGLPDGDLVMDVELVQIVPTPVPPPAPPDAAGPQANARRTSSGLPYRVLGSGAKNAAKAASDGIVAYNYTTWTATGALVDSSLPEGQPRTAFLSQLEPRWRDALSLLRVGDKVRFWLAPGADQAAPLVVDVELVWVYAVDPRA